MSSDVDLDPVGSAFILVRIQRYKIKGKAEFDKQIHPGRPEYHCNLLFVYILQNNNFFIEYISFHNKLQD